MRVGSIAACAGVTAAVLVPALLAAAAGTEAAKPYRFVDLSVADHSTSAEGISGKGEVAGAARDINYVNHPSVWNKKGKRTELALPDGITTAFPHDINGSGLVVANGSDPDYNYHPLILQNGHDPIDLGVPPGADLMFIENINEKGQVSGTAFAEAATVQHPALWQRGSDGRGRWTLFTRINGSATGLNRAGHQVGILRAEAGAPRMGFLRKGKKVTPINPPNGFTELLPLAMNDSDLVVGEVFARSETDERAAPFVWDSGRLTVLPMPSGVTHGEARAVNNRGIVVGAVALADGSHAALWRKKGKKWVFVDLNTQASTGGMLLGDAAGINDNGQIVGGTLVGDSHMAFRLDPR
jgi:uncharacterized membrane protein